MGLNEHLALCLLFAAVCWCFSLFLQILIRCPSGAVQNQLTRTSAAALHPSASVRPGRRAEELSITSSRSPFSCPSRRCSRCHGSPPSHPSPPGLRAASGVLSSTLVLPASFRIPVFFHQPSSLCVDSPALAFRRRRSLRRRRWRLRQTSDFSASPPETWPLSRCDGKSS